MNNKSSGKQMLGSYELGQIYHGDSMELSKGIPDTSVDLILTDPPWSKDKLFLFEWLGQEANRVLKENGLLFTFVGKSHLDIVMSFLNQHLHFYWIICGYQPDSNLIFNPRKMMEKWRPALLYTKIFEPSRSRFLVDLRNEKKDFYRTKRDKRYHIWGQGEGFWAYYLEHLRTENCIIWDPFCGGGTVPVVCRKQNVLFLGFDLDYKAVLKAQQRLVTAGPPLFITEINAEQLKFEGVK